MLRELVGEFAPTARVLVLQLHPRRPQRIGFGRLGHVLLLEPSGAGLRLRGELRPRARARAIAAAGDDERAGALGIGEAEMGGREAAHGQADDVRLVDLQGIEHGADVVAGTRLGIALDLGGHVGGRIAARIVGDGAVTPAEMAKLRLPGSDVAGEFVHEYDRNPSADLLVEQLHAVVGDEMGHGGILAGER